MIDHVLPVLLASYLDGFRVLEMASLSYTGHTVSVMKCACTSRPPQAGIAVHTHSPVRTKQGSPNGTLRCSSITSADSSSRRRAPGYDAVRSGPGRPMYNEARPDDTEAAYDMPASRSNGGAQSGSRSGAAPYTQDSRGQAAYTASGQSSAPSSYSEPRRSRGQPDRPAGQDAELDYQVLTACFCMRSLARLQQNTIPHLCTA